MRTSRSARGSSRSTVSQTSQCQSGCNEHGRRTPGRQGGGDSVGLVRRSTPQLNLLYHGTSNPGPWNGDQRPGDNKWTAAIIARDVDTGEMVWAFQPTPHDIWDYDAVNENILVDLPINGVTRKALVHFDRNGFAYTMDRATGEVILAKPYVPMNWSTGVDLTTGRPVLNQEKVPFQGKKVSFICPSLEGGKNQQPAAFSPKTGLFYVPTNNSLHGSSRRVSRLHPRHSIHRWQRTRSRRAGRLPR